jgi:hypothetical protein
MHEIDTPERPFLRPTALECQIIMEKNKETKNMKKIQFLVKLGQIFVMISMMWRGPLPTAIAQDLNANSN